MERLDIIFFFFGNFLFRHQYEKKFYISLSLILILVLPRLSLVSRLPRDFFERCKWKDWIYCFFFLEIFSLVTDSKNFIYFYLISILVLPSFSFDDHHEILSKCCKWKDWIYHFFLKIFSLITDSKNFIYFYLISILVLPSFSFDDYHEIPLKR